jgi:hypothetical protein
VELDALAQRKGPLLGSVSRLPLCRELGLQRVVRPREAQPLGGGHYGEDGSAAKHRDRLGVRGRHDEAKSGCPSSLYRSGRCLPLVTLLPAGSASCQERVGDRERYPGHGGPPQELPPAHAARPPLLHQVVSVVVYVCSLRNPTPALPNKRCDHPLCFAPFVGDSMAYAKTLRKPNEGSPSIARLVRRSSSRRRRGDREPILGE